jgi:hypothetical protein
MPDHPVSLKEKGSLGLTAEISGKPEEQLQATTLPAKPQVTKTNVPPPIKWLKPAIGSFTNDQGATIQYKAPDSVEHREVVTILAQLEGEAPPKLAGVNIILIPSATTSCATCSDENGDGLFWRTIGMILIAGSIGGLVHGASSFATYVGNQRLLVSWVWWYALRPFIGGFVALMVYLVFRGGISGNGVSLDTADCLKTAGFAGLIGLFSEPALLKLRDIFDTIFTLKNDPRANPIDVKNKKDVGRKPQIDTITPATVQKGAAFSLELAGTNFAPDCIVKVRGLSKKPTAISTTRLKVDVGANELMVPEAVQVQVVISNSPPDGDLSDPIQLTVI